MEVLKVGRWFGIALLLGFIVFDLCGRKPTKPLPGGPEMARAAESSGAQAVDFERLAGFPSAWPEPGAGFVAPDIPAGVRALDGARVTIAGYVLPLEMDGEKTKKFLLCRYAKGCCWGGIPGPHELIDVRTADAGGIEAVTHLPTIFTGVLRVLAPKSSEEMSSGLYRLEEATVVESPGPDPGGHGER